MQGTVSRYDTETFSGAVLTDRGVELPFTVHAVASTPVRHSARRPAGPAGHHRFRGEISAITKVDFITEL